MDHRQHLPKAAAAEEIEVIEEVVELVETGITAKRFSARFIICIHCFDFFTWNFNQNTVREHVQTPDNHPALSLVVP